MSLPGIPSKQQKTDTSEPPSPPNRGTLWSLGVIFAVAVLVATLFTAITPGQFRDKRSSPWLSISTIQYRHACHKCKNHRDGDLRAHHCDDYHVRNTYTHLLNLEYANKLIILSKKNLSGNHKVLTQRLQNPGFILF